MSRVDERMTVDGEPAKRVRVSSDVGDVGGFDTLEEAWEAYQGHRDKIMPILKKRTKKAEGRYWFWVGREQMSFEQFRYAMEKDKREKAKEQ